MQRTVAVVLLVAMLLAVVAGAGYAAAAAITIGGVDDMDGGSVAVTDIATGASCETGTGPIKSTVSCSTAP